MLTNFKKPSLLALSVAIGALLTACGGVIKESIATSTPTAESGRVSMGSKVNLETPELIIEVYQRTDESAIETVRLSEMLGRGKPVVLNFWAALCPPCLAEMPTIQAIYEQRGKEVTIIGIDIGPQQFLGSRKDGKQLLVDLNISYPVGTTFDEDVVRKFEVVAMPTTLFINADGSLRRAWNGLLDEERFNQILDNMLER